MPPDTNTTDQTKPAAKPDDLTLKISGTSMSGWTDIRVTCGIERCPNDFDISLTELYPGQATAFPMHEGDACQVLLGSDPVITGYIDKFMPKFDARNHTIRVTGRGKCQDLVDCSAEWPGGQISGTNALDVATKLAKPYGITVSAPDGPGNEQIAQFNLMLGETAYEIIERICRFSSLLCYEDASGNLVLARAGKIKASSGIVEGSNLQAATAEFSMNERFSEYDCYLLAMDVLGDTGDGGNLIATATDPNVKRHRKKYIITDAGTGGQVLAQARATWEASRRRGRGQVLRVTVDSWRDSAGKLWTPNSLVDIDSATAKFPKGSVGTIGEATYIRDEQGTRCELVLMPPSAFLPEPVLLQPVYPDLNPPPTPPK